MQELHSMVLKSSDGQMKPQEALSKWFTKGFISYTGRLQTWSRTELRPRQFNVPVVPDVSSRGRPHSI